LSERARVYCGTGNMRPGVDRDRLTFKRSSVDKTRLKTALAESARVRISDRWDCPFEGLAAGFAVPLVAAGELYGILDVGYQLGFDASEEDEAVVLPLANHLSVALRNEWLHRETTNLRDYQARLIEQANALILGVGRDWRINVCNRALCTLTGFADHELIGRDLRDWLPSEEHSRLTKLFLQAIDGKLTGSVEVAIPTKSGDAVGTVWSVAAIGQKGRVQALVGIGQDQTQLRDLQGQIIQAEKLATLGQLAAGVVHELNNPLTSITVYAEFLIKKFEVQGQVGDGDIAKLQQIAASAARIMSFARDLVQYAKPGGEGPETVALNTAVVQALSFCEHLFERSKVSLVTELADGLPGLLAVAGQIEQVVINLVTNAVHAMPEGGEVRVETRQQDDQVMLEVSDTGSGIPEADRERVFEPFYTTKTAGEGTGLGLSIVRNIIEQHDGTIVAREARGGGAAFVTSFQVRTRRR
jgi:PAS domain S-box-containing protein